MFGDLARDPGETRILLAAIAITGVGDADLVHLSPPGPHESGAILDSTGSPLSGAECPDQFFELFAGLMRQATELLLLDPIGKHRHHQLFPQLWGRGMAEVLLPHDEELGLVQGWQCCDSLRNVGTQADLGPATSHFGESAGMHIEALRGRGVKSFAMIGSEPVCPGTRGTATIILSGK